MNKSDSIVRLDQISFSRGRRKILDSLSLSIPRGKITAIIGPSGCGKTTLLRLIGGQLQPDSGQVVFDGIAINRLSQKKLYEVRRRMAMLFQAGGLFTDLNVFENVAFPLRENTRLPENLLRDLVLTKLEAVGLRGASQLMIGELSGGMNRRVALARALALDPELIMYDEPFTGQDPITMGVLVQLIRKVNEALGITSILVSHDVKELTSIADYIYMIAGGKVLGQGSSSEMLNSEIPAVKQFMQGLPDGVVPYHYPAKPYEEDLFS